LKKAEILLVIVFLLASIMSACTPGSSSNVPTTKTGSGTTAAPQETELKAGTHLYLTVWGDDARKVEMEKVFQKFTEDTGVTVEVVIVPVAEIHTKLAMQIASKTPPELTWLPERNIPQFMDNDLFEDISALYNDPDYNIEDFNQSLLQALTKDGKLYGIPFSTGVRVFYYNKDLFKQKSLPTPGDLYKEGKWTWDEMIKLAQQVTDRSKGIYGINLFYVYDQKDWQHFYDMLWANGADMFNEECTEMVINNEAGIKVFKMLSDLIFESEAHIKPGDQITFETGKIAMDRQIISYSARLREVADFEWDVVPNPVGSAGKDVPFVTGVASYHIPKGCKHYNEALAALAYVTSAEVMGTGYIFAYFPSPRISVLNKPEFAESFQGKPSAESLKIAFIEPMARKLRVIPAPLNYDKVDITIRKYLDMIYARSDSIENILNTMKAEVDPLLKGE